MLEMSSNVIVENFDIVVKIAINVGYKNRKISHLATTRNCSTLLSGIRLGSHTSVAEWGTASLASVCVCVCVCVCVRERGQ